MCWYLGCEDAGGGSADLRAVRELRSGGGDGCVGGTYFQIVSGEGMGADEGIEGEGVFVGGAAESTA